MGVLRSRTEWSANGETVLLGAARSFAEEGAAVRDGVSVDARRGSGLVHALLARLLPSLLPVPLLRDSSCFALTLLFVRLDSGERRAVEVDDCVVGGVLRHGVHQIRICDLDGVSDGRLHRGRGRAAANDENGNDRDENDVENVHVRTSELVGWKGQRNLFETNIGLSL